METTRLGRTGLTVSRLGFGGIPIQRVPDDEAVAAVRRALELGITFIDTANAYTNSEERIGRAIVGRRDDVVLATKSVARDRGGMERHIKRSLVRLGVERIDLYQFHQVGDMDSLDVVIDPKGPMAALEDAKRAGVVGHIGITSHSLEVAREAVKTGRFETVQFPFNFIEHEAADELVPLARENDVGIIGMKPFAGGAIENVALAIKYVLQFPEVVPIPGMQEAREIEEVVGVLHGPQGISDQELSEMRRVKEKLGPRFCRRCDYCQPCSEGILISMALIAGGFLKRAPREWFFSGLFSDVLGKAADCTECGDCEGRCPYDLPIREMLAEQVEWFQQERDRRR